MNNALQILMNSYGGGTGNLMLYYDTNSFDVIDGTGVVKNVSPASTVGNNDGFLEAGKDTGTLRDGNYSGINLGYSNISINTFDNGFLNNNDLNWSASFLFSFTKTTPEDGILFGCLNTEIIDYYGKSGIYGRGFNIGINDRNQLFFQGVDFENGPYIVVADELELASKNLCSVSVDPYNVTFAYYDLASNDLYQQTKLTNSRVENILDSEKFYLGNSNTYYKDPKIEAYIDQFAILSGDYSPSVLRSIISGFVCDEVINTGAQGFSSVITGYEHTLIQETGITGYTLVQTGSKKVYQTGLFFERVTTITSTSVNIQDGYRYVTGFELANGLVYNEELGYLYETDLYNTTGDSAHATLGLQNEIVTINEISKNVLKYSVKQTGELPLYVVSGLTGFIGPTGITSNPLTGPVYTEGSTGYSFQFLPNIMEGYRHDYLYYMGERI